MTLVFGVGIGTFIILFLLAVSFVLCCISLRTQTKVGPIFIAFSFVFITILLLIPRSNEASNSIHKIEDPHFIARLCLLALLTISTIVGFCFLCVDTLMAQTRPTLLRL